MAVGREEGFAGRLSEAQLPEAREALVEHDLGTVLTGCVRHLLTVYREADGLFPYTTRLVNGSFANNYLQPWASRYSINSLLGLAEASRAGVTGITSAEVDALLSTFLRRQAESLRSPADLGLLLLLLAELDHEGARSILARVAEVRRSARPDALNVQDLAWIIWGAAAATRRGLAGAEDVGRAAVASVLEHFVDSETGLPQHSPSRYRRHVVSFGSVAYFLRAMHEAAASFDDATAGRNFSATLARVLAMQGPKGEWPWMINVRTGLPFDVYPVFAVHQDSMAMLFLLPALDAGDAAVGPAIERSVAWVFGENELQTPMYVQEPFFAYRSIERAQSAPRLRRYLRSIAHSLRPRPARFGGVRVRINDQCRSYHLGWILYVWAGRVAAVPGLPG